MVLIIGSAINNIIIHKLNSDKLLSIINMMIALTEKDRRNYSRGHSILDRLKAEPFNQNTERLLANHPYLKAAEKELLTMGQRKAFAQEQYFIQLSDAKSFARLSGHSDFNPTSLSNVQTP